MAAGATTTPDSLPPTSRHFAARRFWLILAGIVSVAGLARMAILYEFATENPLAERPWIDGWDYWQAAGRMAAGQWIYDSPFLHAPLYPYFLGAVRAAGGDLLAVYVIQIALHLATGIVLAAATRTWFSPLAGIFAAAFFFLLTEPAAASTRILANTLQLLLVTLLWWRWAALLRDGCHWRDVLLTGALGGLLALAYPPAQLLIPVIGLSVLFAARRLVPRLAKTAASLAIAALVIAPATLHNWVLHDQFIPITAHGGVTLRQGNGPEAYGIGVKIPGVRLERRYWAEDAAAVYRAAHGHDGTWSEIDTHFRNLVLEWWLEHPGQALRLAGRKAYMFFTFFNYDDMTPIALEREFGLATSTWLAPLPLPWLLGLALVGLAPLFRQPRRYLPELALFLLPLLITVVFFYSPRYRAPGTIIYCVLAGVALAHLIANRMNPLLPAFVAAVPIALSVLNQLNTRSVDNPAFLRPQFRRSIAYMYVLSGDRRLAAEQVASAAEAYTTALEYDPASFRAQRQLVLLAVRAGNGRAARPALERIRDEVPDDVVVLKALYNIYAQQGLARVAAARLTSLIEHAPDDAEARLALAWLLAEEDPPQPAAALRHARRARDLLGETPEVRRVLAAAHAAAGNFERATRLVLAALEDTDKPAFTVSLRDQLAAYRAGRTWSGPPILLAVDILGAAAE